jgi:hypothetical protein
MISLKSRDESLLCYLNAVVLFFNPTLSVVFMSHIMDSCLDFFSRPHHLLGTALLGGLAFLFTGCGQQAPPSEIPLEKTPWLNPTKQIELLKSSDYQLKVLAARNLGRIGAGAAAAIPELEKLREDKNPKVSKAASEAIEKIQAAMDR